MPATEDNPHGYFESERLAAAFDRLLGAAGSRWDDWGRLDPRWFGLAEAAWHREALRQVLIEEFGNETTIFIKDPRICRFVPFVRSILLELGFATSAVIPFRNPLEVAYSLRHRDGMPIAKSVLIWLRHVLDAEYASRGMPRCFCAYDDLLADWRSQMARAAERLGIPWLASSDDAQTTIDRFLSAELHRQRASTSELRDHPEVPELVLAAYEALTAIFAHGESAEVAARLDALRVRFDEACRMLQAAVAGDVATQLRAQNELSAERDSLAAVHSRLIGKYSALVREHKSLLLATPAEVVSTEKLTRKLDPPSFPLAEKYRAVTADPAVRRALGSAAAFSDPTRSYTLCCIVDADPRFHVEFVLWALCAKRRLPQDRFHCVAYRVGDAIPDDLIDWAQELGLEIRPMTPPVPSVPHCNKIAPFFDDCLSAYTIVCDTDLFFVDDPSDLLPSARLRAAPNNHNIPPPHIFKMILAVSEIGRDYRPGLALFPGFAGRRETHLNNNSDSIIVAPHRRCPQLAASWKKWADWLVEKRHLLGDWGIHADQVAFTLALEEMREDIDFLPPQMNTTLHLFDDVSTSYAFHLSSGHIPEFSHRFNDDRTLVTTGLAPGLAAAAERLNVCIREASATIKTLPSTQPHFEKFLNHRWNR